MKAFIAQKIGMTQLVAENGLATPATILHVPENFVVMKRTEAKDGADRYQIGVQTRKKVNQPLTGILKKAGIKSVLSRFQEVTSEEDLTPGTIIDFNKITNDTHVTVIGTSKGKGFAGTVKRHNFATGPKTHGSHNYRQPGSIGAQQPQRVIPGKKMAGHMGVEQITVKGLKIIAVSEKDKTVAINGPIPGPKKSFVFVRIEG